MAIRNGITNGIPMRFPLLGDELVIINGLLFFTDGTVLQFTDDSVIYFED